MGQKRGRSLPSRGSGERQAEDPGKEEAKPAAFGGGLAAGRSRCVSFVDESPEPSRGRTLVEKRRTRCLSIDRGPFNTGSGYDFADERGSSGSEDQDFHDAPTSHSRELRSMCLILDLLASNQAPRAADLVAQRIKALERSMVDYDWWRAQHLELIPPVGATLIDREEDMMIAREDALHRRQKDPKVESLESSSQRGGSRGRKRKGQKGQVSVEGQEQERQMGGSSTSGVSGQLEGQRLEELKKLLSEAQTSNVDATADAILSLLKPPGKSTAAPRQ